MATLVRALGEPVTSTSANLPGSPPAPGAEAIVQDFAPAVEAGTLLVLDGGVLGNSPPSTIVDCTQRTPRLIREGALKLGELRRAAGHRASGRRSEEHTSELQSQSNLVCRLLLEKKKHMNANRAP